MVQFPLPTCLLTVKNRAVHVVCHYPTFERSCYDFAAQLTSFEPPQRYVKLRLCDFNYFVELPVVVVPKYLINAPKIKGFIFSSQLAWGISPAVCKDGGVHGGVRPPLASPRARAALAHLLCGGRAQPRITGLCPLWTWHMWTSL